MVEIEHGTLEEKVLRFLLDNYPATIEDVKRALGISLERTKALLHKMHGRGLIVLRPTSDKTYVEAANKAFSFLGIKHNQKKAWKRGGEGKAKGGEKGYDGFMFG